VVLASGADYRRLQAANAGRFEGSGLYYVATHLEALQVSGEDVVVAGGGNSAGQAAMTLTCCARTVHVVARRPLEQTMSRYLIDRISDAPGVMVWTGYDIGVLHGEGELEGELEGVTVRGADGEHRLGASAVFAMIGARPRTSWLAGFAGLDDRGFIVTGEDARRHPDFADHWRGTGRTPLLLESTQRDVFAIGDVRADSTKRVASAVGDGALVARSIHDSIRLTTDGACLARQMGGTGAHSGGIAPSHPAYTVTLEVRCAYLPSAADMTTSGHATSAGAFRLPRCHVHNSGSAHPRQPPRLAGTSGEKNTTPPGRGSPRA
jgi:thioredoxin reductase